MRVVIIIILFFLPLSCFPQSTALRVFESFDEIPFVENQDSLCQLVTRSTDTNSYQHANNLIIITYDRILSAHYDLDEYLAHLTRLNTKFKSPFLKAFINLSPLYQDLNNFEFIIVNGKKTFANQVYENFIRLNDKTGQFLTLNAKFKCIVIENSQFQEMESLDNDTKSTQINFHDLLGLDSIIEDNNQIAKIILEEMSSLKKNNTLLNNLYIYSLTVNEKINLGFMGPSLLDSLKNKIAEASEQQQLLKSVAGFNNLIGSYYFEFNLDSALHYFRLAMLYPNKKSSYYSTSLSNLANVHFVMGNWTEALNYLLLAAKHYEKYKLTKNIRYIKTIGDIAVCYEKKDKCKLALLYSKKYNKVKNILLERSFSSGIKTNTLLQQIVIAKKEANYNRLIIILGSLLIFSLIIIIVLLRRESKFKNKLLHNVLGKQKMKNEIYTLIAHDIISPIRAYTNLSMTLNHWIKQNDTEKIKHLSSQIEKDSLTLSKNLDNFFAWASENNSITDAEIQLCSIGEIVTVCLEFHKGTILEKRLKITNSDTLISCNANKIFLTSIVRNALDNAIKNAQFDTAIVINYTKNENSLELSISNEGSLNKKTLSELNKLHSHQVAYKNTALGQGSYFIYFFCKKIDGHVHYEAKNNKIIFHLSIPVE